MNSNKQTLIISGAILAAALLVLGGIFYVNAQNKDDERWAAVIGKRQDLEKQIKQTETVIRDAKLDISSIKFSIKLEKEGSLSYAQNYLKIREDFYWKMRKSYSSSSRVVKEAKEKVEKEEAKVAVIKNKLKGMKSSIRDTEKNLSKLKNRLSTQESELKSHIARNYPRD